MGGKPPPLNTEVILPSKRRASRLAHTLYLRRFGCVVGEFKAVEPFGEAIYPPLRVVMNMFPDMRDC